MAIVRNSAISGCCSSSVLIGSMTLVSNRLQSGRAKSGDGFVGRRTRGWLGVPEFIIHPELLPFEAAHLVKRQHVHPLNVAQSRRESRDALDLGHVIRPAGHEHETNPDRLARGGESSGEFMNRPVVLARQPAMQIGS